MYFLEYESNLWCKTFWQCCQWGKISMLEIDLNQLFFFYLECFSWYSSDMWLIFLLRNFSTDQIYPYIFWLIHCCSENQELASIFWKDPWSLFGNQIWLLIRLAWSNQGGWGLLSLILTFAFYNLQFTISILLFSLEYSLLFGIPAGIL